MTADIARAVSRGLGTITTEAERCGEQPREHRLTSQDGTHKNSLIFFGQLGALPNTERSRFLGRRPQPDFPSREIEG